MVRRGEPCTHVVKQLKTSASLRSTRCQGHLVMGEGGGCCPCATLASAFRFSAIDQGCPTGSGAQQA